MEKQFPNAICIFSEEAEEVSNFIEDHEKDKFNFFDSVTSIEDFIDGIDNGTIDNNIDIIFIYDGFFDPTGQDNSFENFTANYSQYCLLFIVNYNPEYKQAIISKDEEARFRNGFDDASIYFIDINDFNGSVDRGIEKFIHSSNSSSSVVEKLTGGEAIPEVNQNIVKHNSFDDIENILDQNDDEDYDGIDYLGQIVAVTSSKGGSGKSTIAMSLASFLAKSSIHSVEEGLEQRPLKVLLLDLDVRDGQVGFLTGKTKPTVLNIRTNSVTKNVIENTVIHDDKLSIDLLLAPKRPRYADGTPPDFYIELLQKLKKMYDYIILDTSVNYLDPLLEKVAYPMADQIIFVTDFVITSIFSMTRWIQEVTNPESKQGMNINKGKIGIVINKVKKDVNLSPEKIAKASLNLKIIAAVPACDKLVAHAANLQSMEYLLKSPEIYKGISMLAKSVVNKKYKLSANVD